MINTLLITKEELKASYCINIEDCQDCLFAIEENQWCVVIDTSNIGILTDLENYNNSSNIEVLKFSIKSAIARLKLKEIFPQYDKIVVILVGDYNTYE